jgi:putative oxidoreductase
MARKIFISIITGLLICLFIYTAISKLIGYNSFKNGLAWLPITNINATVISLIILIALIWVSVLLFMPGTRLWGLYGSAMLMLVFTLYAAYLVYILPGIGVNLADESNKLINSVYIPWGTHHASSGVFRRMNWNQHLIFNTFFLLLSITGIVLQRRVVLKRRERELPPVVFT